MMKQYREYKDTDVEWIGKIPKAWEVKRFGYLFSFGRGLSITKADLLDEGIPCVSYGEIHSKYGFEINPLIDELRCVHKKYLETSSQSILKRGDFVFADTSEDVAGSGNFTCLNSDATVFAGYHSIIVRQKDNYNYRYLSYFFDSIVFRSQIRSRVSGTKVFSITQSILKETYVILPPVHAQIAISVFLDNKTKAIDTLIIDKQRLIDLLKERRQAIISEVVTKGLENNGNKKDSGIAWIGEIPETWNVSRFSFEAWVRARLGWKGLKAEEYTDDGYVFLSTPNIKSNEIDFENVNYISKERYNESPEIMVKAGDVLLAKDGSTLGTVNVVRLLPREATVNSSIAVISPYKRILSTYLMYFIKSNYMEQIIKTLKGGMGVPHLFQEDINKMKLLLPPLEEQERIIEYLDLKTLEIDALVSDVHTQIERLVEYRQSIISEVVTGKVAI